MKRYTLIFSVLILFIAPLSAQRRGGSRPCTEPLTNENLRVIEGTVEDSQLKAGKGMPTLLLRLTDGSLVNVTVGPYSAWMDNDFSVEKGDQVVVNAFACFRNTEALAALQIVNQTRGTELRLRDDYGRPLSRGRGRGSARGGRGLSQ